jgi:DNA-binding MarR family transcriptional regulator
VELYLGRLALAYRAAVSARLGEDPAFAELGLRPPSMGTLRVIDAYGPISQKEVSERLGVHAPDMVGIVDALEGHGLLLRQRSTEDRRRYDLTLTPKGKTLLDRFLEVAREVDKDFYAVLSPTELKQLEKLMGKLVGGLAADRGPRSG